MQNENCTPTVPLPQSVYEKRRVKLEKILAKNKLDAAIIEHPISRFYLTGFTSSAGVLLMRPGHTPEFFTDHRYLPAATLAMPGINCSTIHPAQELFKPRSKKGSWKRVGYDAHISHGRYLAFQDSISSGAKLVNATPLLEGQRVIKGKEEIAIMRRSVAMADLTLETVLPQIRSGMSEWEIRCLFTQCITAISQRETFPTIVAAGRNSAYEHHAPGATILRKGQPLLVDLGAVVQGYGSDITRTLFMGSPSPKLKDMYAVVLATNQKIISKIKPGVAIGKAVLAGTKIMADAGYFRRLRIGHGLGLGNEGLPMESRSKRLLEPGMMLTVEPGIYLPGIGGVRIEEDILVTTTGCEILTKISPELTCL